MDLTSGQIMRLLDLAGISYTTDLKKNWMPVLCPFHSDSNYGNAGINLDSAVIHCFACDTTAHISKALQGRMNFMTMKQTYDYIREELGMQVPTGRVDTSYKKSSKAKFQNESNELSISKALFPEPRLDLDPDEWQYTKERGFTKDFIDEFGIYQTINNFYDRYMIIPIVDQLRDISIFEARKIGELEIMSNYLGQNGTLTKLREMFQEHCLTRNIHVKRGKLYWSPNQGDELRLMTPGDFNYESLLYLSRPKVLYPKGAKAVKHTLFNLSNLSRAEPLFIVEGIGGLPKIWTYLSRNVTCLFGAKISDEQIDILREFTKKIIIPDPDTAGTIMVKKLTKRISDVWVMPVELDDNDPQYVMKLLNTKQIEGARFILRMSGVTEEI